MCDVGTPVSHQTDVFAQVRRRERLDRHTWVILFNFLTYKFYNETHVHMNIPYIYILLIHAWRLTHTHTYTFSTNHVFVNPL